MTDILTVIGTDNDRTKTFKAGGTIAFGEPVKLSAAGIVVKGTGTDSIGWAVPLDEVAAENSAENYTSNDLVLVKMKGDVMNARAGTGGVAVGSFIKGAADGEYVEEATATTKTVATEGIALTAASEDGTFEFVRMS